MTYRLPALQPLWSFVSPATLPHVVNAHEAGNAHLPPVLDWSPGPNGRPSPRWRVNRAA